MSEVEHFTELLKKVGDVVYKELPRAERYSEVQYRNATLVMLQEMTNINTWQSEVDIT